MPAGGVAFLSAGQTCHSAVAQIGSVFGAINQFVAGMHVAECKDRYDFVERKVDYENTRFIRAGSRDAIRRSRIRFAVRLRQREGPAR